MAQIAHGRPGRPAAATRGDALALASERFLSGERVDVQAIALDLGLARATMHRWFGTRESFLGETLAAMAEARLEAHRHGVSAIGATALVDTFDAFNRELVGTRGLRIWLEREQERALRVLTSSAGIVQPRMVLTIERLILAEVEAGAFAPTASPGSLAYAIVRLAESFLYNDAIIGIRGDCGRLREVQAALLGVR